MGFEIYKCSCGKEIWFHSLEGKLVTDKAGRIFINDGNHAVNVLALIYSLGVQEGDTVRICVEKE